MGKLFTISWPKWGKAIQAELFDAQHTNFCESFWTALPAKSIQSHAVCAGIQMYFPFRMVRPPSEPFTEPMNAQPPGRVNLELDFQYLSINYGAMEEPVPAVPIAQIKAEDLIEIEVIGKLSWENLVYSNVFVEVLLEKQEGDMQ